MKLIQWGRNGFGGSPEEIESSGAELEYWLEELVYLVCVCVRDVCDCAVHTGCVAY